MTEQKKPLTDEEKAARAAEAQAKIAAAKKRQEDLMNYENNLSQMPLAGLRRECRRIAKNGGLDTALATVSRIVLENTRITKSDAFEIIKGKQVPRSQWINELGKLSCFLK